MKASNIVIVQLKNAWLVRLADGDIGGIFDYRDCYYASTLKDLLCVVEGLANTTLTTGEKVEAKP